MSSWKRCPASPAASEALATDPSVASAGDAPLAADAPPAPSTVTPGLAAQFENPQTGEAQPALRAQGGREGPPLIDGPQISLPLQELIERMPKEPGVYLMKDKKGRIIYVGKAANLRQRV